MKILYRSSSIAMLSLSLLLCFSENAHAHGLGLTFTSTTTAGIIDVDYDSLEINAESSGRFAFFLFQDAERTKPISFTDIWVRIYEGSDEDGKRGQTLFAGPVFRPPIGGAGFLFVFPKAGVYTMSVRYNDSTKDAFQETITEGIFQIDVLPAYGKSGFQLSKDLLIGIGGGIFLSLIGIFAIRAFLRSKG